MVVFVVTMIVGFALGVRVMAAGVLRTKPSLPPRFVPTADRVAIGQPLVAVVATAFGVVGVVLTRVTGLSASMRAGLSGVVAVAAAMTAAAVIRRWARAVDEGPPAWDDDPRYTLQGLPARVTRSLGGSAPGEIEYEFNGVRQVVAAFSINAAPIGAGVEVVIDRVDAGIAWVEAWEQVERRM